jgi:hypothetical protein
MIPTSTQNKKVIAVQRIDGNSALIAGSARSDGAQNVISVDEINGAGAGISTIITQHTRRNFVGFIAPTATDYANANMGDTYDEFTADSAESAIPHNFVRWVKTQAGWERLGGRKNVRTTAIFGDATTRYDVTVSGAAATYTNDAGTAPAFVAGGLRVGDKIVIGGSAFNAANLGTFKVLAVTASAVTVENTSAVAEANIVTGAATAVQSYDTIEIADDIVLGSYGSGKTLTLPTAVGCRGKVIVVKAIGAGTITLDGAGSETVDGSANASISTTTKLTVVSDGAGWQSIA